MMTILIWLFCAIILVPPLCRTVVTGDPRFLVKILLFLFLIALSLTLYITLLPIALCYGSIRLYWRRKDEEVAKYYYDTALANDMSGGVMLQHMLNDFWVKPHGVRFGLFGISISKILADNQKQNSWYRFAQRFGQFLDWLDRDHLKKSTR